VQSVMICMVYWGQLFLLMLDRCHLPGLVKLQPVGAPFCPVEPRRVPPSPVEPRRAPLSPVEPCRAPSSPVEPRRAPSSPVKPRRAPSNPVEPRRASLSPVQPGRAQPGATASTVEPKVENRQHFVLTRPQRFGFSSIMRIRP
jgi:hypothetical protein